MSTALVMENLGVQILKLLMQGIAWLSHSGEQDNAAVYCRMKSTLRNIEEAAASMPLFFQSAEWGRAGSRTTTNLKCIAYSEDRLSILKHWISL